MKDEKTPRRSVKRKTGTTSTKKRRNKTCDECPSTFLTLNGLTEHKKIHKKLEELNYRCSICEQTFYNAEKFRKHMFMHDVKLYKCENCGASFKYLQSYMRHLKDYPEPHYFPCGQCNKVFMRLIFLNRHFCNSKDEKIDENFYSEDETSTSNNSLKNFNNGVNPDIMSHMSPCHSMELIEQKFTLSKDSPNGDVPLHALKEKEILNDLFEFNCKECNWMFSSKFNLMRHLEIYSDKHFIYPCCGNQLKKNSDIMNHICSGNIDKTQTDAASEEEKLNQRKEITSEKEKLNQSKEIMSEEGESNQRKEGMSDEEELNQSTKIMSDEEESNQGKENMSEEEKLIQTKQRRIYECDSCPAKFFRSHSLKRHKLKNPNKHDFPCNKCKKLYLDSESLDKHLCILQDDKEFKCSCLKLFKNLEDFKNHVGHQRPYYCCVCKKKCDCLSNLINHIRTHTKEKPFPCSFCDKSFSVRASLTIHIRKHTGEKPFKCSKCIYSTITKWNLYLHESKHQADRNGQKKFLCAECGTMFYRKHHLRRHILTHSKKKKISCKLCKKKFNQISYLNKHLKTHNKHFKCPDCNQKLDEKDWYQHHADTKHFSFVCDPCKMVFRTKTKLRNHLLRFHNKFICTECGNKFANREKWEKHIKKNHEDYEEKKLYFKLKCYLFFKTKTSI